MSLMSPPKGLMSLPPHPEPVTHCPNTALCGLAVNSQQKAAGGAEDKVRKGNQGQGAASKHRQAAKPDIKPGLWQQLRKEENQDRRLCVQSLLSLD